ncbi:hypothetical protein K3G39_09310 [Pontibacter sp. HSC-14F20]|uniref:hypothetical protein n=1 Tax=Pontibacter sp. HSC-14F20 TaxID=2864136 RepID=UPI001C739A00|nr:hypothetical protein [Pontibacter sp. HSC-14F20]MBX0333435.1 hypothetical protein [Pontibacter sp. HSC-14F20]
MEKSLPLEIGTVQLLEDKIFIQDNAKREHIIRMVSSALWTFYGTMSVLRYLKTGDEFFLWTGLLIGIGHLVVFILSLFRTTKAQIDLAEVQQVAFKTRNSNRFLDLTLSSGKKRRISRIAPAAEELRTFFEEKQIQVK